MTEKFKHYLLVAKPGIVMGNLVSAAAGFFLASKGRVDPVLLLSTIAGISLVVASGCVFTNCIDRDIDGRMSRTCNRVLVKRLISIKAAGCYASLLGIAGFVLLWRATNTLAVGTVLAGFAIYVGLYSLYLKRNSAYAAPIGSLAGAAPPLAAYCAVSQQFDTGALLLLLIFSLWQMPHCYAIAIYRFDDFTAAGIPILPVKRGPAAARKHIIVYILAFMAAAFMLSFCGYTGHAYLGIALVLSLLWLYLAWSGFKTTDARLWAKKLFVFSVLTIFVLSIMMSVDSAAPNLSNMLLAYVP